MASEIDNSDQRPVFYFDIDNCLYSKSNKIHELMQGLIDDFFVKHLSLSAADALMLHQKYYKDYGLAIEGLARFHKIDPLEFNRKVDDALPLDDILLPNPHLRQILESFDPSKVKLWLFTNAYITHGKRVVKLLGIDDLFEGVTYCDYAAKQLVCKPRPEMFEKAEIEAGAPNSAQCYFVGKTWNPGHLKEIAHKSDMADDSYMNCVHAHARGWQTVHLVEAGVQDPPEKASNYQITHLSELPNIFPHFLKTEVSSQSVPN